MKKMEEWLNSVISDIVSDKNEQTILDIKNKLLSIDNIGNFIVSDVNEYSHEIEDDDRNTYYVDILFTNSGFVYRIYISPILRDFSKFITNAYTSCYYDEFGNYKKIS
jgi:hypothetical protein